MKKFRFKSIRTRLTFWFLILTLLPLFIVTIITFNQLARSIEQETFNKLIAIRDLKIGELNNWLNEKTGDLYTMSGDFEIRGLDHILDKHVKSPENIEKLNIARKLLNRYQESYKDYEEMFFVGTNTGLVEISSNKDSEGNNKSLDPYFTVPLKTGKIYIKDIYYSKTLKKATMTFSYPVFCLSHGTHIIGIIVARINLDRSLFSLLRNRIGLGKTGETLIVNKDAVALNELRWHENAPLKFKLNAIPAVNAAHGKTGITITSDYRDEKVMAAYTYIPETGWGFICKQDMYELNAPIRSLVKYFTAIFIIFSIVILLIVFWVSKKISNPIFDMNIVAQKIKGGDYSARNIVSSWDELGSLAETTNQTLDYLESLIATQKGVSNISEIMIEQSSMQDFGSELLKQLMEITSANMSTFYILNETNSEFEHFTSVGANEELLKSFSSENPQGEFGNALSKKSIYYLQDIPKDTIFKFQTTAGDAIPKEIITIPIMIEGTAVALISLVNIHRFGKECIDILKQSWMSINTSYSSLLGNERTRILAENLSKTNQQLEAQSEELQEQTEELQSQTEELSKQSEELQEQNLELEMQKKQVEEANRLKSEFLSNMSHELRTPLNSIMALSRVLIMQAKNKLSEEENNYLEIVERNGSHLLSLINDILDLSKIEAGKMDLHPEFISLNTMLKNIKDSLITIVREKDLDFKLNIADDLPKIETDESKLHQALQNVISNSVKFTEKGNIDITVNFDSEKMYINIKDTGIGIPQEALPLIFEEFRQVDGSFSRKHEGTGLGLAIAYKMIKILGGDIQVKSELDKGSLFSITIPIKWAGETEITVTDTFGYETEQKNKIEIDKKIITKGSKILIVEDNEDTIIQMKAILKNEDYIVDVATGGKQALEYVKHTIPDGIILDLMMPEVDGFEVLENIRSTKDMKNIPVLVLTAKDLAHEDLSRLSANNIQQLVKKGDIDIDGLLFKIKLTLGNEPKRKREKRKGKTGEPEKQKQIERKKEISELPRVLVVEDNPDNMSVIKAILKGKYSMLEAYDGKQGLNAAITELPDVILLDISLPEMDGLEVVRILKNNNETSNIPVIAVTARAMKEDKEAFLAAGCDDYVAKPVNPKIVLKKLEKWLGR